MKVKVNVVFKNKSQYGFYSFKDENEVWYDLGKTEKVYDEGEAKGSLCEVGDVVEIIYTEKLSKAGKTYRPVVFMEKKGTFDTSTIQQRPQQSTGGGGFKPRGGGGFNDPDRQVKISMAGAINTAIDFMDMAMQNGVWKMPAKGTKENKIDTLYDMVLEYSKEFFARIHSMTPAVADRIVKAEIEVSAEVEKGNGADTEEAPTDFDEDVPDSAVEGHPDNQPAQKDMWS